MLKISQPPLNGRSAGVSPANHSVTLKLEGRVIGPWVAELKMACERHLSERRAVKLDVADVSFADRSGTTLLRDLRSKGVRFLNCSPFLEEELKSTNP
jgi:hypothetical protein